MAWFWRRLLKSMDQQVGGYEAFRAYTIGHLGKYVPGKLMVIVLRTGLIRSANVDGVIAAVTVLIETLTMMAAGAFLSAITLLIWFQDQRWLQLLAVGLMLGTVFLTLPPVLRMVVYKLKSKESPEILESVLTNVGWSTMVQGWLASCVTWALITISLWATLRGLPNVTELSVGIATFGKLLSCISLAIVAGFIAVIFPGGIGPREWVLNQTLVPMLGPVAIVATIALRLIWTLTELLISFILYVIPPRGLTDSPPANE